MILVVCMSPFSVISQLTISFDKSENSMPLVGKSEKLSSFHKFTAPISSFSTLKQHNNFILEFEDGLSFSIEINEIQTISSNHPINLGTTNPLQNIQAELDNPIQVLKGRVESLHSSQVLFVQTNSGIEGLLLNK